MSQQATTVPTVLIGIGGIGGRIVSKVCDSLQNYEKQYVRFLSLDTNVNDLKKIKSKNIPQIQTSAEYTIGEYLDQNSDYLKWFPVNPLINARTLKDGAGQIRSASRLGALASEAQHRFDAITDAIKAVNVNQGANLHSSVRVMIVGSMCGGTASGIGVQLPFLIRQLANMPGLLIRGLFIMPDICEEVQDTDEKKRSVYVNAYAFLRELNAFNMAQTYQKGTGKLAIEHYDPTAKNFANNPSMAAGQVPYNFLFLIEQSNRNAQNIGKFDAYIDKAAEIVKSQLFTADLSSNLVSSEDNLIVNAVNMNGMNRYCGAGFSKAVYPEAENIRYCTLRYTESILQEYWLRVDRMVANNIAQNKRQMASDYTLMPTDAKAEYRSVFDEITDPKNHEVQRELALLKRELVADVMMTDEQGMKFIQHIEVHTSLAMAIKNFLDNAFASEEIESEAKQCQLDGRKMGKKNSAASHVRTKMNLLEEYEKHAKERVGSVSSRCIEAIMPMDIETAKTQVDPLNYPYSIYAVLRGKHPIIARYILYYIRDIMITEEEKCSAELAALESQETVFTKDYYHDKSEKGKDNRDDPVQAINLTKEGVWSFVGINSSDYTKLSREIIMDFGDHISRIGEISNARLKQKAYHSIIARMDILIEIYEQFFKELETILINRRQERETLEMNRPRIQNSDLYVCADTACKKKLYSEFEEQLQDADDMTLPESVKTNLFDVLLDEYRQTLSAKVAGNPYKRDIMCMETLFDKGILVPMASKFEHKEFAHIKMDIAQAIQYEYDEHCAKGILQFGDTPVDAKKVSFLDYFKNINEQLRELATPYISYHAVSEKINKLLTRNKNGQADDGRVVCYWGVNNQAIDHLQRRNNDGSIDLDGMVSKLGDRNGTTYYLINNDSFDVKELSCYSSVYDLCVENLNKYESNQKTASEYKRRIGNVEKGSYEVGAGDSAYLETVHPHLDKHWHAHSYLPMLRIDDEVEEQKRIAKAFLLSVACSRCWYISLDRINRWAFRCTGSRTVDPLSLDDQSATRGTYTTLYKALDECTYVVDDIMAKESADRGDAYNSIRVDGITIADLKKQPIIAGFIGGAYKKDEMLDLTKVYSEIYNNKKLPVNILDVIYFIFKDSYDKILVKTLIDNLSEYLHDYCLQMTDNQPGYSDELYHQIAEAIKKNFSEKDTATVEFKMMCEDFLG